jgi:hypothetical protein
MTQIGCGPTWKISGPLPAKRALGLLQAADGGNALVRRNPSGDLLDNQQVERWLNGVELWPYPTDVPEAWDGLGSPGTKPSGADPVERPMFAPFTVVLGETCSTFGTPDQDAFVQRARLAFDAAEGYAIERELLTGNLLPLQPHLADANTDVLGSGATSVSNALALLENAIAETGRDGVIHCTPGLASKASEHGVVFERTLGGLRTINGTLVIPAAGYVPGATPDGEADPAGEEEWVYATNGIDVYTTAPEVLPGNVAEALDRSTNTLTYRVEAYALAVFDTTFKAAVLADRCQANC